MKTGLETQKLVLEGLAKEYQEKNDFLLREARQLRRKAAEEASAIVKHANAANLPATS